MYGSVSAPSLLSELLAHDAFRHGALTKSCARFLAVILEHGVVKTLEDVMRFSGLKERCCKDTSKRLREVNLVVKTEDGWIHGPNTLDAVAKWFETEGKAKRQKEKHMEERVAFTKKVEKWKQEKEDAAAQKAEGQQENERTVYRLLPPAEEMPVPVHVSENDQFIKTTLALFDGAIVERECLPPAS